MQASSHNKLIMKKLFVVLLLILPCFTFEENTYCIKSSNSPETSEVLRHCRNYTNWLSLISDSSRYFKSYTKIYFLSDTFNLSTQLTIDNVTNISINGIDSIKLTSIKCSNHAFLSISNATSVQIENFELIACGRNVARYIKGNEAYTALFLRNVSVSILNVMFKNSYGHSIIGIDLIGYSVLQQVSVLYMNDSNVSKMKMGGIVLMFSDEITNHIYNNIMPRNIIIEHCQIHYMENIHSDNQQDSKVKWILRSLAFGLDFNQQKYSANVTLMNTNISTVTKNGPLICIKFNSSHASIATIISSHFLKNNVYNNPIIEIKKGVMGSKRSVSDFKIKNCTLLYNKARSIFYIYQLYHSNQTMTNIETISTKIVNNQVTETFWKAEFHTSPKNIHIISFLIKLYFCF